MGYFMSIFATAGVEKSKIDVRISYRIIQLFSEGLYKSPNKAIEELVSNAFDAGATKTHVIISPDLGDTEAIIAIIDNGQGMNEEGLEKHWLIGISDKRNPNYKSPRNRKQIGKFGIGKLATYVLANEFTHITKVDGKYFAATMDYKSIPEGEKGGIYTEEKVRIPLRELTEEEVKKALAPVLAFSSPDFKELTLFGKNSEKSWTVAIMSNLKEMAREIRIGRLKWVLETAMPLRDDFDLYLNNNKIISSKVNATEIKKWILGKDIKEIPFIASDDIIVSKDDSKPKTSFEHYGLVHTKLGRITGYSELYEDLLTQGKSIDTSRSHGFFVYVRGRLINIEDEYFGIDSNLLRHGTFSRFRAVVHIDSLDEELRSTREDIRHGALFEESRNLLRGIFNIASKKLLEVEKEENPGVRAVNRIANTPKSLTQTPLVGLVDRSLNSDYIPKYTNIPIDMQKSQIVGFINEFKAKANSEVGAIRAVEQVETLSPSQGIAVFNPTNGVLQINLLHPFVAQFFNEYNNKTRNVSLELFAISEVLLEAHLLELGIKSDIVTDILNQRDELFRTLSSTTGRRNSLIISQDLKDAATNKDKLENELVAAFDSLGFDAVKISGKDNPDGVAEAFLSPKNGQTKKYKITLEAKSKEKPGTKVSAKSVGVSTLARHRRKYDADYSVVVGPDFPTKKNALSALAKEISDDREKNPGKGITLIRIEDMSKLVRLRPVKRLGLDRIRELLEKCSLPEESKKWIEDVAKEKTQKHQYKELLDVITEEQKAMPTQQVEYMNIVTGLRKTYDIRMDKQEVIEHCKALSRMAPGFVYARNNTVELTQKPKIILDAISTTIGDYPEDEKKNIK